MTENTAKIKAQIASVSFGGLEIEGLLLPDGSFAIAVPQICSLFQFAKDHGNRTIKALLGNDFQFAKVNSTLNPKPVNVLRLTDFEKLVFRLALKQNQIAIDFSESLIGLSLHQLFCDAFKIKFEAAERQEWLTNRQLVKESFRKALTDSLKEYGYTEPWQYGKYVHAFQHALGIEDGTRDSLSIEQLARLDSAQRYIGLAIRGFKQDPWQVLKGYMSTCNL